MNEKTHLKYMLLVAAGVLGVLLLAGRPLEDALLLALLLACPLMMVFMMGGGHGGHGGHGSHPEEHRDVTAPREPDRDAGRPLGDPPHRDN